MRNAESSPTPVQWPWRRVNRGLSRIGCLYRDAKAAKNSNPNLTMLVSYPKSGATWLQFMLGQILIRAYDLDTEPLTVRLSELTAKYPALPRIQWTHDGGEIIYEDGTRPDPHRIFMDSTRLRYRRNRVILLVRDPRDIVVSLFHQVTRRSSLPMVYGSLSAFLRDPLYGFARIIRFYRVWYWNRRVPRRLLLVPYERMLENGPRELKRVVDLLKIDAGKQLIQDAYESSAAQKLRNLERNGMVDGMRTFGVHPNEMKVRKAKAGTYREEMTEDDIEYCNRLMAKMPPWYGYRANVK